MIRGVQYRAQQVSFVTNADECSFTAVAYMAHMVGDSLFLGIACRGSEHPLPANVQGEDAGRKRQLLRGPGSQAGEAGSEFGSGA